MVPIPLLLGILLAAALIVWLAMLLHVLQIDRQRAAARALRRQLLATLDRDDVKAMPVADRVARVRLILDRSSRELLMYAAADSAAPGGTFDVLAAYMGGRWAGALERDAIAHHTARDRWRRVTALRILFRLHQSSASPAAHDTSMTAPRGGPVDTSGTLALLARAVDEADDTIAEAAFALLAQSADTRAMDILLAALRAQRHPASRIASYIEASPQLIGPRLRALLGDTDPVVRLWGATLLARYPDDPAEAELVALTTDHDPRVRKAALQTLGIVGDTLAAECAATLLADPVTYVRAHAARCLAELGRTDMAAAVARLLADHDWWTRLAARESLELMGSAVWPVVMRCLSSDDEFVRNGAAEVIQNIGVLDSLIVMEAASDNPGESKIAMLRTIAHAGGVRFTESLVERSGPVVGARIRSLLSSIGLEHVEAV